MSKEEKRRKFHSALMNIYSSPEPPLQQPQSIQQIVSEKVDFEDDFLYMDPVSENDLERETSSDDAGECVPQKLTRAQRKRIRKKKLKEAASLRRKIIGPLLPTQEDINHQPFDNQNENAHKYIPARDISTKSQDSSCAMTTSMPPVINSKNKRPVKDVPSI